MAKPLGPCPCAHPCLVRCWARTRWSWLSAALIRLQTRPLLTFAAPRCQVLGEDALELGGYESSESFALLRDTSACGKMKARARPWPGRGRAGAKTNRRCHEAASA